MQPSALSISSVSSYGQQSPQQATLQNSMQLTMTASWSLSYLMTSLSLLYFIILYFYP